MAELQRRESDEPDYDPRRERRWHGPPQPEDFVNGSEVRAGWGDKALTLRGPLVITVVLMITLGAIFFYLHDIQRREHAQQLRATNMTLCVSLYDFNERKELRKAWQADPKAPRYWCPNFMEASGPGG